MPSRECPSYKKLSFNFLWQCLRNGVRRSTWREWITYNFFRQSFSLDPPTSTFLYSNLSCGSTNVAQSNLLQSHKNTPRCTPLGRNFWVFKNSGTKMGNVICYQCPSLGQPQNIRSTHIDIWNSQFERRRLQGNGGPRPINLIITFSFRISHIFYTIYIFSHHNFKSGRSTK